jgi:predicted NBD/HSP70 family sugar kinase
MENISGNALVIKEININLVRKVLKTKGLATKQQIAKETGLSLVTVGTVIQHLMKQKEVFESEQSSSSGGRPAQQYRFNDDISHALILFPYETNGHLFVRSTIVNLSGRCVQETDTKVELINLKTFEVIITSQMNSFPTIEAIGFGQPGVEINGRIIISDYKMLIGTTFTEHYKALYHVPVVLENDVNCAVVGFANKRNLSDSNILIYLYFPDNHPPGAGILINGGLFKGKSNFAGEISTIPLDVKWDDNLYLEFDKLCEAITRLVITICSILNPDRVIFNGNFLNETHVETITQNCNARLTQNIAPVIQLSDNFVSDYQSGLTFQTLRLMEPEIRLTRKQSSEDRM